MRFGILLWAAIPALLAAEPDMAAAQLTEEERAALVLELLPQSARAGATIVLREGDDEKVVREGDGAFLCVSDASRADRLSMVCHHHVLEARLRFERELRKATGLTGAALRERICEDAGEAERSIPDGSMEITASLSPDEDGDYPDEMTVYRLLWMPGSTPDVSGIDTEDPGEGRPYLHQAGTCGAHVMWSEVVPTG